MMPVKLRKGLFPGPLTTNQPSHTLVQIQHFRQRIVNIFILLDNLFSIELPVLH